MTSVRRHPPIPLVLLPVLTALGCCGPCTRCMSSSTYTPPGGPPSVAPPGTTAADVPLPTFDSPLDVHPKFPWRRAYRKPRVRMMSNGQWVEQLARPFDVFDAMPSAKTDGVKDGLVVCKIRVTGRFDEFRDPEVTAWLHIGARAKHEYWGPEDERDVAFSMPRSTWNAGDNLLLQAEDRDVTGNDAIGSVNVTFDGKVPVTFTHPEMNAECRAWSAAEVEEKAKPSITAVTDALGRARTTKPQPGADSWGYERSAIADSWAALDALAAYVGLDDARVAGFSRDLEKVELAWTAEAKKSVAAEIRKMPPLATHVPVKLNEVDAIVEAVVCDAAQAQAYARNRPGFTQQAAEKVPCFVRINATRTSPDGAIFLFPDKQVTARLVLGDGSEVGLETLALLDASGKEVDEHDWKPKSGERFTVLLIPTADVAIATHPGSKPANADGPARLLRFVHPSRQNGGLSRIDG